MISDKALRTLVEDALEGEPSVPAANIGVAVKNGIVSLTGHVSTSAQKLAAEWAVKRIEHVRGLAQEMRVLSETEDAEGDEDIAARIADLIDREISVPRTAVRVQVTDGHVLLAGEVDRAEQRLAAEQGVRSLRGVRDVANQIMVKPDLAPIDIKRHVDEALKQLAAATQVRITVLGDMVRLEGKVRTEHERAEIEHAALAAPGVRAVEDHMTLGA